jgi:mevalonate kinase
VNDSQFYGHGKILLTGEYFVLEGALSLALPTTVGQSLRVKYRHSNQPTLKWSALDHGGKPWFETEMELWHFESLKTTDMSVARDLQTILQQVRRQNPHFLREELDVQVETKLEFPRDWGLGSSSSLLYNIAQWAYVSPFELAMKSFGGSGYDIACAQSMGPIHYQLVEKLPKWQPVAFAPSFQGDLYLVYLGQKRDTRSAVEAFRSLADNERRAPVETITSLTKEITVASDLKHFERVIREHEALVGSVLKTTPIKQELFSDYWGEVKSLGAWGGDFALVTSVREPSETREYFAGKGLQTFIPFQEIICGPQLETDHVR